MREKISHDLQNPNFCPTKERNKRSMYSHTRWVCHSGISKCLPGKQMPTCALTRCVIMESPNAYMAKKEFFANVEVRESD